MIADIRSVALVLERVCIQAGKDLETIPDDVIISFSSTTTFSDIITTQYQRTNKDQKVEMSEIDDIIKRVEGDSFLRVKDRLKKEYALVHDDLRLVSSSIIGLSIDGKMYTNPLGVTGRDIRLTILNIFMPATEYNVIRSVVASLGKKTISLIPSALVFSKIIERSECMGRPTMVIDLGYHQMTVLFEDRGEITAFETFSFGTEDLFALFEDDTTHYSPLQIEKMLFEYSQENANIEAKIRTFLEYMTSVVIGYTERQNLKQPFSQIFLHGAIFENIHIRRIFDSLFRQKNHTPYRLITRHDLGLKENPQEDSLLPYGLSIIAHELLLVKKDPIIRILRYILYSYE
jgi:hypothetical protein